MTEDNLDDMKFDTPEEETKQEPKTKEPIKTITLLKKKVEEKPTKATGMGADFQQFINDEATSDVKLSIYDDDAQQRYSVFCHRLILATRCPVLKRILDEKKEEKEIFIDNIHRQILFDQLIQFLYTDFVQATEDTVMDLIKMADTYEIVHLKVASGAYSKDKLTDDNWLDIYNFARKNRENELADSCLEFICENFENGLQEHKQYRDLSLEVLLDILQRDDVQCDELTLFNIVLDWGAENKKSDDDIKKALKLIRLPIIGAKSLRNFVRSCPLIDKEDYMEAIEYCAMPQLFEERKEEKQFHRRRAACRFIWTAQRGQHAFKLTNDGHTIEKTGPSNWDLVALSSEPFEAGVQYFQVKIDVMNTDRSGLAMGLTAEPGINPSSYSNCISLSMEYGPYNLTAKNPNQGGYTFKVGDVIGFLVDFVNDEIKVFENGKLTYTAGQKPSQLKKIWACVFMYYQNDQVSLCNDFPLKTLEE